MKRTSVALLLVVTVLLAGCGGSTSTPSQTTSPDTYTTSADPAPTTRPAETTQLIERFEATGCVKSITQRPGGPTVNVTRVSARVGQLLGTEIGRPCVLIQERTSTQSDLTVRRYPYLRPLGYVNATINATGASGHMVPGGGSTVYLTPGNASAASVEQVLAHETAHLAQWVGGLLPEEGPDWSNSARNIDASLTSNSLTEGGAAYVADAYTRRYLPDRQPLQLTNNEETYRTGPAIARFRIAPYLFGQRYIARRIDSPRNLSKVYEHPPRTTEQLLHNLSAGAEPPTDLTVANEIPDERWDFVLNHTMGELFVRTTLGIELDHATARRAAAGWGNDDLYRFEHATNASRHGYAWVLDWDTREDAAEFETAVSAYAAARRADGASVRVTRVDARTVGVFFGDPAFVDRTTATSDGNTVTISQAE